MRIDSSGAVRFLGAMRFLFLLALLAGSAFAAVPPALETALASFRTEGARNWSFTQTTKGEGRSRVETYDAAKPDFERWTLLQENGRAPTADELQDYREKLSRRSRGGTAPRLADQLDLTTVETLSDTPERATYRCKLKPGETGDRTAEHLLATIVLHKPTGTIELFSLAATGPFSPAFGVHIEEMNTTMRYSLPAGDQPSFLLESSTRLRGRAFMVKSLDADLTVTFTDHHKPRK